MKKIFAAMALVAALFIAGNVQAQSMVYAGYAPETFVYNNSSDNFQGFFAGFTQNFGLSKGIGVAAGAQLRYNTRSYSSLGANAKDSQFLIDVPILFNYGIAVNRDITIAPFVGPMVSLALTGKTHYDTVLGDTDLNWYDDNSNMSRFNLYAVFGVDVKFSQFNVFGGYRLGLIDLYSNNVNLKTNGLFVGLGYTL